MVKKVGATPHQWDTRPSEKNYSRLKAVGTVVKTVLNEAINIPAELKAGIKAPNAKEAKKATRVAFGFFSKENKPIET